MSIVRRLSRSTLLRGSLFVFITNNIFNLGNFLYNLLMGRLLGPALYGDLGAINSFLTFFSLPLAVINLLLVKEIAHSWGKKNLKNIRLIINFFSQKLFIIGLLLVVILSILSQQITHFLQLDSSFPLIVASIALPLSGFMTINKASLQGMLSFQYLAVNSLVEVSFRIFISTVLVLFNFKLVGALLGPLFGSIVSFLLSAIQIKILLGKTMVNPKTTFKFSLKKTVLPVFLVIFSLSSIFSLDIIFVRHFFSADTSGNYVALSTMGKIIFYAVGPFITVMFPHISSKVSNNLPYLLPLAGSLTLTLIISLIATFLFFMAPKFIINLFYGDKFVTAYQFMGLFAFYMSLYSLISILTHFFLSISYYLPIYLLSLYPFIQSLAIYFLHQQIEQIIWINISLSSGYLIIFLLLLYFKEKIYLKKILAKKITPFTYV